MELIRNPVVFIVNKIYCLVRRAIPMVLFMLLSVHSILSARSDTSYSFIVAGHAYGSHTAKNIGLHPALLNSLNSGYDSNAAFIVFTGDIVRKSTTESWQQVEDELSNYPLPYYYAMGNHDANELAWQVFENKFGSTYYAFNSQSELFIVLNSTEDERSVSSNQVEFLQDQINNAGDTIRNIFIFFHEVLWNSHEKYIGVISNSRSRYDQMVDYSNYWEEVHPMLSERADKNFFLIAGDVGGNREAISAFYDTWDHITFVASGMGEVDDENYLLVLVHTKDSVEFELVPLNSDFNLPDLEYHTVPPATEAIIGPSIVPPGVTDIEYSVPEVFNATSYEWELPAGANGTSTTSSILVSYYSVFEGGILSIRAARDGFGQGPATTLTISAESTAIGLPEGGDDSPLIDLTETNDHLSVGINSFNEGELTIRIFDIGGKLLQSESIMATGDNFQIVVDKNDIPEGIILVTVFTPSCHITKKFIVR